MIRKHEINEMIYDYFEDNKIFKCKKCSKGIAEALTKELFDMIEMELKIIRRTRR